MKIKPPSGDAARFKRQEGSAVSPGGWSFVLHGRCTQMRSCRFYFTEVVGVNSGAPIELCRVMMSRWCHQRYYSWQKSSVTDRRVWKTFASESLKEDVLQLHDGKFCGLNQLTASDQESSTWSFLRLISVTSPSTETSDEMRATNLFHIKY